MMGGGDAADSGRFLYGQVSGGSGTEKVMNIIELFAENENFLFFCFREDRRRRKREMG